MANKQRNNRGRFATDAPTTKKFDLLGSLQSLFTVAQRAGDYSACASLARVIKDLTPEPASRVDDDDGLPLEEMTDAEKATLDALIDGLDALKVDVRQRLGLAEAPV